MEEEAKKKHSYTAIIQGIQANIPNVQLANKLKSTLSTLFSLSSHSPSLQTRYNITTDKTKRKLNNDNEGKNEQKKMLWRRFTSFSLRWKHSKSWSAPAKTTTVQCLLKYNFFLIKWKKRATVTGRARVEWKKKGSDRREWEFFCGHRTSLLPRINVSHCRWASFHQLPLSSRIHWKKVY